MLTARLKAYRPSVTLLILLVVTLVGCSKEKEGGEVTGAAAGLPEVPSPSLSELEPVMQRQIEEAQAALKNAPNDLAANGRLAMLYHLYGLTDAAAEMYRRAALLDPQTHKWHYLRASCLGGTDRKAEVIEDLQAAVQVNPKFVLGWIGLGYRYLDAKELDAARQTFQKAAELTPDSVQVSFGLGQVELQAGRPKEAIDALRRAVAQAPQAGVVHRALADAYEKAGDSAAAANARLLGCRPEESPPVTTPELDEVEDLATGSAHELRLANQAAARRDFEKAMLHVDRAIEYAPRSGEAHFTKAKLLLTRRHTDEALQLLRKAAEALPNDPLVRIGLADALLATDQADLAREQLEQALSAAPERIEPRLAMSQLEASQGNAAAAAEQLQAVLAAYPEQIEARFRLGQLRFAQGKPDEAKAELERVLQARPGSGPAHYLLAAILGARGEKDQAILHARSAIQAQLRDARVDQLLAQLYWSNGQYGMVDQTLNDGLRRSSGSPMLINSLAWLRATCPDSLYRNGAEAVRLATSLTEKDPENPQLLDTLAAAQAESGDFDAAVKTQQKVIALLKDKGTNPAESDFEKRLALYQSGRPYRDEMGSAPSDVPEPPTTAPAS